MAHVIIENIEKTYANGFKAIHGVNVEIDEGELLVLVGPSGCGKSTLLRMVAGLEETTSGKILIAGREVTDLEPAERDIAMVFQNYALYPHMNVFDNMAYGLKIRKLPPSEIEARVKKASEILELTDEQLTRKPRQLSGGQRQRVAMGRAIVREPSVFLFDEPLSNLDAKLRVQMRLEIKKLQERLGITSIYVTHDQVEAMTLGHRLMVLNDGIVEQLGTPIELYNKPASVFVAGFIGSPSMNFINAAFSEDGISIHISGGETYKLQNTRYSDYAGKTVKFGVRPEHMMADDDNAEFHMEITMIEHLGADTLVHGHFGFDKTNLTVRVDGTYMLSAGEKMPLKVAEDHFHFFDYETDKRILPDS